MEELRQEREIDIDIEMSGKKQTYWLFDLHTEEIKQFLFYIPKIVIANCSVALDLHFHMLMSINFTQKQESDRIDTK